jgi:hypothetical protein
VVPFGAQRSRSRGERVAMEREAQRFDCATCAVTVQHREGAARCHDTVWSGPVMMMGGSRERPVVVPDGGGQRGAGAARGLPIWS